MPMLQGHSLPKVMCEVPHIAFRTLINSKKSPCLSQVISDYLRVRLRIASLAAGFVWFKVHIAALSKRFDGLSPIAWRTTHQSVRQCERPSKFETARLLPMAGIPSAVARIIGCPNRRAVFLRQSVVAHPCSPVTPQTANLRNAENLDRPPAQTDALGLRVP
jgi:hypothetical protein